MGQWRYWLQIAGLCCGCSRAKPETTAEPIASTESSASVLSAVPAPAPNANVAIERTCVEDAARRSENCRSACSNAPDAGTGARECKRECLAGFAREEHSCRDPPGAKPLPWFDLHANGARPEKAELARKLEDAVLSAGTGCSVRTTASGLPTLLLWAAADGAGKITEVSVHPLENVDGEDLPGCLELEISRKSLPATGASYAFIAPIVVPGRAVELHSDSAQGSCRVAAVGRAKNRGAPSDNESRWREREAVRLMQGMLQQQRAAGEPEASAENCEIVRRNLALLRSGGLSRAFPHLKADPEYEKRLQEAIRKGEEAERRVCR